MKAFCENLFTTGGGDDYDPKQDCQAYAILFYIICSTNDWYFRGKLINYKKANSIVMGKALHVITGGGANMSEIIIMTLSRIAKPMQKY